MQVGIFQLVPQTRAQQWPIPDKLLQVDWILCVESRVSDQQGPLLFKLCRTPRGRSFSQTQTALDMQTRVLMEDEGASSPGPRDHSPAEATPASGTHSSPRDTVTIPGPATTGPAGEEDKDKEGPLAQESHRECP